MPSVARDRFSWAFGDRRGSGHPRERVAVLFVPKLTVDVRGEHVVSARVDFTDSLHGEVLGDGSGFNPATSHAHAAMEWLEARVARAAENALEGLVPRIDRAAFSDPAALIDFHWHLTVELSDRRLDGVDCDFSDSCQGERGNGNLDSPAAVEACAWVDIYAAAALIGAVRAAADHS